VAAAAPFVGFLALALLAAGSGMLVPPGAWYEALAKPAWTPPDAAFPIVWSVLYVCIGVSAALVWRASDDRGPLVPWGVQLVLNALWSALFFGLHWPAVALVEIVVLWLAIAATIRAFRRVRPLAAWLLVPYLAWVTLATALNASIWWLNR
jgi:tryptophan-rich sensory protein